MKKPHLIRFSRSKVESFDALGELIPELSGPYSDELKERVEEAKTPKTVEVDAE